MVVQRVSQFVAGRTRAKASYEADKAFENLGRENDIMPGLVPSNLGGLLPDKGFYITPDTPADPTDCARYPNSPFCGGNPFTFTPIGIEPEIIDDGCNLGIRLNPVLAFIRLPPVALVYRKKKCRGKKAELPKIPEGDIQGYCIPTNCGLCNITVTYEGTAVPYGGIGDFLDPLDNADFPSGNPYSEHSENPFYPGDPTFIKRTVTINKYRSNEFCISPVARRRVYYSTLDPTGEGYLDYSEPKSKGWRRPYRIKFPVNDSTSNDNLYQQDAIPNWVLWHDFLSDDFKITDISIECLTSQPPPPNDPCLMTPCCPCDDTLLRLLLKKVNKLSKIVGVDEYPASLPKSLISKDEGFIGNLIPNGNDEIPNLTQLLAKFIHYYDELMGQWELAIEVKDSDPSMPGDQPQGIKLPNMAEAMGELITLVFQTHVNSETILNIATRNLLETGTDKQQNFISYKLIQSISDYLGFKQKDKPLEMPLLFTPSATRYDSLLQESKVKVVTVEFDEKFGLEADLMRLRKVASILDSVYFRKVDPTGDIKSQIITQLLRSKAKVDKINDEDDGTQWEAFLRQVEEGYGQLSGVDEPMKPYGREYAERPKVRDLTDIQPPEAPTP